MCTRDDAAQADALDRCPQCGALYYQDTPWPCPACGYVPPQCELCEDETPVARYRVSFRDGTFADMSLCPPCALDTRLGIGQPNAGNPDVIAIQSLPQLEVAR